MKIIRRFRQVGGLVILYCSKLAIRSKNINVYGSWFGQKFADNSAYLYLASLENKDVRNVWITKNKEIVERLKKDNFEIYYAYSLKGIWWQLRAENIFVNTGAADVEKNLIGGANLINLWHGVPLKKIMYEVNPPRLEEKVRLKATNNFIINTSKQMRPIYKAAFRVDEEHSITIGQPRTDIFFDKTNRYDFFKKVPESLETRIKNKKILLYAPTHRLEGKKIIDVENLVDLKKLDKLMADNGCIFLIKKHFYQVNDPEIPSFDNIIDITKVDIDTQFLLSVTDLLITDYSSIYIDYLLRDKPIMFFRYDLKEYLKNDREMYFDYDEVTPGIKVSTGDELLGALNSILIQGDKDYVEMNKNTKNLFFGNDFRNSSRRILDKFVAK
ncbi:CDP-glycerol--poly(glycerophosphate) glycerophosphotransferase [Latilactobacillus sakei]|uniref:CDP-glycerol--poly(glycerophosphate) glycerophosphotransferase n=1 Tax=Latilactobacillus sakei TaxID=1599 RepID=UPI0003371154|nr:CDP-glycerol--poly(glycerophosphate) glycerophosphotransferase [Latilactobacillus sakei]EOR84448.1 CDP-glycerol:poly(glycerophosphate) glycerophosphotransferase [Latilactobacillus sakei subsp. sakei LS25]PKX63771.1 CDP-glycerol--poly(glycerophosphate) glycerophosphotransferase [Latilactobacillus sakei]PKX67795.1 CDP-glycerol--poly(glycerophosphate) glycerophosphotransferase [Latilactobacillus sakei]SOB39626.1 CDP-glycerol:poly(Glycerophosphate) glycerophosphotransferase [Latilactobacillus sa